MTTARLVKLATSDGLFQVNTEKAAVGKIYQVNPATIRVLTFFNIDRQVYHEKQVIDAMDAHAGEMRYFPLECLEIEAKL